jgi:hypothetical protein
VELPGQEPKLVVNALLEPSDSLKVFLTKSMGILEGKEYNDNFESVKNARVNLINSEGKPTPLTYFERYTDFGTQAFYFLLNPQLKPNENYIITAESVGFQSIKGEIKIPELVPIKEVSYKNLGSSGSSVNYELVEFTVKFEDLPGKNFYEINGDFFGVSTKTANSLYSGELNPSPVNPVYKRDNGFGAGLLFVDSFFDGKNAEMVFRTKLPRNAVLKVKINLLHVSESYFRYEDTANLQNQTRDDFFSQPVLVYSNIENGLGILKARNKSTKVLEMRFLD